MERKKSSSVNTTKDTDYGTVQYEEGENVTWKFWKKRRYVVGVLAFFGFFTSYILRVNLSVAIVAMTSNSSKTDENGNTNFGPEFDWDSKMQGLVLSSFFYGYISTQLLGGWLAARIGGKRVFGLGIAATALLTLITPPLARMSVYVLITLRIVEGIFEGVTYPCIHALWANWAPPMERSKLATLAFSGSFVGTVFAMPVSGLMAEYFGWASIFYVFGVLGLIWFVMWWYIVTDKPEDDPHISEAELKYIKKSLGDVERKKITHPWKAMLTSPPLWAIVAAHFSENWGFYTMLTQLPTFMSDVLNFKLEKTGFLSALPYLVMAIVLQFSGHLADNLRAKKILTTTQVRKIFNCGAFLCQTIFMTCAAFVQSTSGAVACITIAVGLGGFAWSGFSVNHLDIAPQHASVMMGIGNTIATLPGIISPIITGYIVENKTAAEWRTVFIIAGSVYLIGAVIYGLFASGERQSWAIETKKENGTSYDNSALEVEINISFICDVPSVLDIDRWGPLCNFTATQEQPVNHTDWLYDMEEERERLCEEGEHVASERAELEHLRAEHLGGNAVAKELRRLQAAFDRQQREIEELRVTAAGPPELHGNAGVLNGLVRGLQSIKLDLHCPKFGSESNQNPTEFLQQLENYFVIKAVDPHIKILIVENALDGRARTWYNSERTEWSMYTEFKLGILEEFYSIPIRVQMKSQWMNRRYTPRMGTLQSYFLKQVTEAQHIEPLGNQYETNYTIVHADFPNTNSVANALSSLEMANEEREKRERSNPNGDGSYGNYNYWCLRDNSTGQNSWNRNNRYLRCWPNNNSPINLSIHSRHVEYFGIVANYHHPCISVPPAVGSQTHLPQAQTMIAPQTISLGVKGPNPSSRGPHTRQSPSVVSEDLSFSLAKESINDTSSKRFLRGPQLIVSVFNIPIAALVDTGSQVTCISEEYYVHLRTHFYLVELPVTNVIITTAVPQKPTKVKKQVHLVLAVGCLVVASAFLVIPYLTCPMILGNDWFFVNRVVIDYQLMKLILNGYSVPSELVLFDRAYVESIASREDEITCIHVVTGDPRRAQY